MQKRTRPQQKRNNASPEGKRISWKYSALTVICGAILVVGFFFAARQHFSSMDYGIRNSRLRKQLDELESEKRRLLLNREISLSPSELMKAERKIGFDQYSTFASSAPRPEAVSTTVKTRPTITDKPVVQKTVINKPVQPAKTTAESKPAKTDRQAKKETR
jgi:hypothetical protein